MLLNKKFLTYYCKKKTAYKCIVCHRDTKHDTYILGHTKVLNIKFNVLHF